MAVRLACVVALLLLTSLRPTSFGEQTRPPDKPGLAITRPYDENPATVGNGVMIALVVDSNDKVDALMVFK